MSHVVLALNGAPPPPELTRRVCADANRVVAVDGGIRCLVAADVRPHVHIGDFDSSTPSASGETRHRPDQAHTDLEKALVALAEFNVTTLTVLGGTGGRSDHFLTNLLVLSEVDPAWSVRLLAETETLLRVTPECPLAQPAPLGTTVSLVPLAGRPRVTTRGLRWELDDSAMGAGRRLGQSNETVGEGFEVRSTATLWVVVTPAPAP